eukprot:1329597-Rhodomonas_salina.1
MRVWGSHSHSITLKACWEYAQFTTGLCITVMAGIQARIFSAELRALCTSQSVCVWLSKA